MVASGKGSVDGLLTGTGRSRWL